MRKLLHIGLLAVIVGLLTGCLETTQVFWINPDGSGKVTVDTLAAPPPDMGQPEGEKPDAAMLAKNAVRQMISQSEGVEAWSDVSHEVAPDGRIHVKGTAYFADLAALKIDPSPKASLIKDESGGLTLKIEPNADKPEEPAGEKPELTEEEIKAKIEQARMEYQQAKPMAAMFLGSLKIDSTYRLPGTVGDTNMLQKTEDGTGVRLVIEGKKMLEAMDKFNADDAAMAAHFRSGKGDDQMPEAIEKEIFGGTGDPTAKVGGELKPLFDYAAESATAKSGQAEMLKKLGVELDSFESPEIEIMPAPEEAPDEAAGDAQAE